MKDILESIDRKGGRTSYKSSTNSSDPWNLAFELYNKDRSRPLRKGCEDCRNIVYNWLRINAT